MSYPWVRTSAAGSWHAVPALGFWLVEVGTERAENGVRNTRVFRALLGVQNIVIEASSSMRRGVVVVQVRPAGGSRSMRGVPATARWYDRGEGRRRWRGLDAGAMKVFLEADAPRVYCPEHGPIVAQVPWARHSAGHTLAFDEQVAWLATQCSKTAITELMRIAWRTVGAIIARVWADGSAGVTGWPGYADRDREISYKRGYRYLVSSSITTPADCCGPLRVMTAPRCAASLISRAVEMRAEITHVSADGAVDRRNRGPALS